MISTYVIMLCACVCVCVCVSVDTPDEPDKTLPEDDLQKNLAFLLDRVEGCSVRSRFLCLFLCLSVCQVRM